MFIHFIIVNTYRINVQQPKLVFRELVLLTEYETVANIY